MCDYKEDYQIDLAKNNKQLLMIMRPTNFLPSEYAKQDNHFMLEHNYTEEEIKYGAIEEHKILEKLLFESKIGYKAFEQTIPEAHDSCFLSDSLICIKNADFPKGLVIICPMYWPHRRLEKHPQIYHWLKNTLDYQDIVDLSYFESEGKALEGKGVTLFDWKSRTLYVSETNRAHKDVIEKLAEIMSELSGQIWNYFLVKNFDKKQNQPHFHTSSFMMIFDKCAVICSEVLVDQEHFQEIKKKLEASGKEVFECSYADMENGATLGVEVFWEEGTNGLMLSDFCANVSNETKEFFKRYFSRKLYLPAPILVDVGGSSLECLIQTVPL